MNATQSAPTLPNPGASPGDRPLLSIVIPAYNEQRRLGRTLAETVSFLRLQSYESELLIVDDGSSDATSSMTQDFVDAWPGVVRLLRNPGNRGKGFAVQNGMLNARGEVVLFFDADLSTPLSEVNRVLQPILEDRCDVVVGTRAPEQRGTQTPFRQFLGHSFQGLRKALLGIDVTDTQCGFKAFRRAAARAIFDQQRIEGFAFDVEILFIAKQQGWRSLEVPVEWVDQEGSKVQPIKNGIQMGADLVRIRMQHSAKRRFVRYPTRAAVRVERPDGAHFDCFVTNLSRGGLYLLTDQPAPAEKRLTVMLPMPDGDLVPLPGRVVYSANSVHQGTGMGVELLELADTARERLELFLRYIGGD